MVSWQAVPFSFPPDSPLHAFTEDEVTAIFAAGTLRACAAGEAILAEGEPGDSMFFLVEGSAEAQARQRQERCAATARAATSASCRSSTPGTAAARPSWPRPTPACTCSISRACSRCSRATRRRSSRCSGATCAFLVDAERNLIADLRRQNTELQETVKKLEFTRAAAQPGGGDRAHRRADRAVQPPRVRRRAARASWSAPARSAAAWP